MKRSLAITFAFTFSFMIAGMGRPLHAQVKPQPRTPQRLGAAAPTPACCSVTSIDSGSGIVTAKVNAGGATFQFKETSGTLPTALHPGSPVYANFPAKQVSLDGTTMCCTITSGPSAPAPAPPAPPPSTAPAPAARPAPTPPVAIAPTPRQPQPTPAAPQTAKTPPPPFSHTGIAQQGQPVQYMSGKLPSMTYGTPQPVTSGPAMLPGGGLAQLPRWGSRSLGGAQVMHVRGVDGLEQVQGLPEGIKNLLAIHVRKLPKGESDHYIINVAQAQEWINTHPIPADVKPTDVKTGDGHSGCNSFSWHCAEESAKHAADEAQRQADDLRHQAQADWDHAGGQLTQLWHEALSCLDDHTLHLDNIPVKFSITPQMSIDAQKQGRIPGGVASGKISGTLGLATQVDSDMQANLDVFYIPCLPFVVRPKDMGAVGTLGVTPKLTASLDASGQFDKTFDIPPTGDPHIPIEVIPIIIAGVPVAELDISVHFEGNINVGGEGKLTASFEIDDPHQFAINFSCSGHGCVPGTGNVPMTRLSPPTTTETYKLEGNVHVKPDIYVALEMNFDYDAATVRIGPQPYLWGQVNGCGTATATQNLNTGSSTTTESYALVSDLDWGMILRTEFLVGGNKEGDGWNPPLVGQSHIWLKDLWPGGSTALLPQVQGLTQTSPGQPALYHIKMPACYPFFDNVKYQLSWTGPATASISAPGTSVATRNLPQAGALNGAGVKSTASPSAGAATPCRLQSGQGSCEFDPLKDFSLNLAWPAAGTYNLSVTAVGDTHGRVYNPPNATALTIAVGSPGSASSAATSSAPSGGTPPAPPAQGAGVAPTAAVAAAPAIAGTMQNNVAPACCHITAIDASTGIVTAIVNATGRTFQFQVTDSALLNSLMIGEGVYANFKTYQVSLDDHTVCCKIINISPGGQSGSLGIATGQGTLVELGVQGLQPGKCLHSWLPSYGGVLCRGTNPSRPAILLVHGLHQTAETWTKPSSTGYYYDFRHTPADKDLGDHSVLNAGLYKVGPSELLNVDPLNWLDYLVAQGFTVATWSQPCCNFAKAYDSAKSALAQFASDVALMYPVAPPPIALIGHSRGGLVIHKLLREQGSLGGRIHWMITIHSPHHGSLVAETPEVIVNDSEKSFDNAGLPSELEGPLREAAIKIVSPLHQLIDDGSKELAPDSPLITGLLNGDAAVPGVQYYTFGGTNPMLVRLYTWLFTPDSALPQYKNLEQYFHWTAKPAEVGLVSPLLNSVKAIVPEIKAGQGDSLVTDVSARLAYSTHETDQLNHAEVLWDRTLQEKVALILSESRPLVRIPGR